eukprot:TRINITY_DN9347_c0_g1_i1.p1 TRINITY_DN9347_c0_g1~~TRINITY_DN9347_c0_g1_i1.p1  ORF type:complete len:328 (-),score=45.50 TRINITY_DN9347_c0_g1_i1:35-1018(-)
MSVQGRRPLKTPKCCNGHPITKCKEKLHAWQGHVHRRCCDQCGTELKRHDPRWRCEYGCQYNLCLNCYNLLRRQPSKEPKDQADTASEAKSVGTPALTSQKSQASQLSSDSQQTESPGRKTAVQSAAIPTTCVGDAVSEQKKLPIPSMGHEAHSSGGGSGPAFQRSSPKSSAAAVVTPTSAMVADCLACVDGLLALLMPGEAGQTFLKKKAAEPGVIASASGLLYKVLRQGAGGIHPTVNSRCECHYRGTLIDGLEFDSSYRGYRPVTFMPCQVIKGWAEALQLMVAGDCWELYVPPHLAYGDAGMGGVIPPGAVLVFRLELIRIRS